MRSSTPLDKAQETAWKRARSVVAETSEQDWQAIEWYYRQTGEVSKFRRRDLATLLNNWNGECERARIAAHNIGFAPARIEAEPDGWQEFMRAHCQDEPVPPRWDQVRETLRDGIREQLQKRPAA